MMDHIGQELHRLYKDEGITKILTIEASGIAIAMAAAHYFNVPMLFAKKSKSSNISSNVYTSMVHSFTYDLDYPITVVKDYLTSEDRVLIVDDFLANGEALKGLVDVCNQAKCTVAGIGICVEKCFQPGGRKLRDAGYRVESLAMLESIAPGKLKFKEQ